VVSGRRAAGGLRRAASEKALLGQGTCSALIGVSVLVLELPRAWFSQGPRLARPAGYRAAGPAYLAAVAPLAASGHLVRGRRGCGAGMAGAASPGLAPTTRSLAARTSANASGGRAECTRGLSMSPNAAWHAAQDSKRAGTRLPQRQAGGDACRRDGWQRC
jgi:hypothetical protein